MSSNVRVIDHASRSEAAHARAHDLVREQRRLVDRLDQFFRDIAEVRELMRDEGSLWEGPALDPPVEAAFGSWVARGPVETRVELRTIPDVPMMGLE